MTTTPVELTTTVYTVPPDTLISDIARLMVAQRLGDVIVTEGHTPVGILTDRDIVTRVIGAGLSAEKVRVRDVMSQPAVTISKNAEAKAATELMSRHGIRRLPIVDDDNRLVSILTMDDVLLLGLDNLPELQQIIRRQHPDKEPAAATGTPRTQSPPVDWTTPVRGLSGTVEEVAPRLVIIPVGHSHYYPIPPKAWHRAAKDWLSTRLWVILLIVISLFGAVIALTAERYGRMFYSYNPQSYEPKDMERQIHQLKEEIRKLDEERLQATNKKATRP